MRYGLWPSNSRTQDTLIELAKIAHRRFYDTIWLDRGVKGFDEAVALAKACLPYTQRVIFGIVYHPKAGDDLAEATKRILELQQEAKRSVYVALDLGEFPATQRPMIAQELGGILPLLLNGKQGSTTPKTFTLKTTTPLQAPEKQNSVYLKTENDPELIKIAGELYHGVISHPTVEYFGEVYKLVTVGAKKTGNPLAQFDFGVSLPTWFGDLTIPSQLKARVYDILRKTPKDHVQALPSTPDQLSPAQITTLSWSGDIYEVNTRLMEYYSVFGDIGNPDNRFPFHVILEEPFGKDILQALILVADESAYNYRIPFSCEFEKEVRKVKDWHPEAF